MTIYIDFEYKCHAENDGTMRAVDVEFFDGKCPAFIKGYRYVPNNEAWIRSDGVQFNGEMVSPLQDYNILAAYQEQYGESLAEQEDMQAALELLGVNA